MYYMCMRFQLQPYYFIFNTLHNFIDFTLSRLACRVHARSSGKPGKYIAMIPCINTPYGNTQSYRVHRVHGRGDKTWTWSKELIDETWWRFVIGTRCEVEESFQYRQCQTPLAELWTSSIQSRIWKSVTLQKTYDIVRYTILSPTFRRFEEERFQ